MSELSMADIMNGTDQFYAWIGMQCFHKTNPSCSGIVKTLHEIARKKSVL